jgi:hypothetical protein
MPSSMPTPLEVRTPQTIEHGSITFLYRPRPDGHRADELHDVQRLLLLLAPDDSAFERLIAVGRTRVPRSTCRDRFWGFVDMVLTSHDMTAALSAQIYGTNSKGLRHIPAAHVFAEGTYTITVHGDHSHLRWHVEQMARDPIAFEIQVERDADHLLTIANPDPAAWGLSEAPDLQTQIFDDLELHVTIPASLPAPLQQRFGDRPITQLDSTDWLDHPGTEIVFAANCSQQARSNLWRGK